jgi:hypothetical protein
MAHGKFVSAQGQGAVEDVVWWASNCECIEGKLFCVIYVDIFDISLFISILCP